MLASELATRIGCEYHGLFGRFLLWVHGWVNWVNWVHATGPFATWVEL